MRARHWCVWWNVVYAIAYTFALCGSAAEAVSTYCIAYKEEPSLLFNSIRQLLLFSSHCWEHRIMVVSMATPTCGAMQTFIFVRFRDKDAGCCEGSGKRPYAHDYKKRRRLWLWWLLPRLLNVQQDHVPQVSSVFDKDSSSCSLLLSLSVPCCQIYDHSYRTFTTT